eukprot:7489174-Lingulodinium_polyedra.AAC.1
MHGLSWIGQHPCWLERHMALGQPCSKVLAHEPRTVAQREEYCPEVLEHGVDVVHLPQPPLQGIVAC